MQALKPGDEIVRWCSLVAGYPAYILVKRRGEGNLPDIVAVDDDDEEMHDIVEVDDDDEEDGQEGFKDLKILLGLHLPRQPDQYYLSTAGVKICFEVSLPSIQFTKARTVFYHNHVAYGFCPPLNRRWKAAMNYCSPLFIDNKLQVVVNAKYAMN
jgi:hypothetical protein